MLWIFFFWGGEALIGEGLLFQKSYFLEGHSSERGAYQRVGAHQIIYSTLFETIFSVWLHNYWAWPCPTSTDYISDS